jgi:hypothetical protein
MNTILPCGCEVRRAADHPLRMTIYVRLCPVALELRRAEEEAVFAPELSEQREAAASEAFQAHFPPEWQRYPQEAAVPAAPAAAAAEA